MDGISFNAPAFEIIKTYSDDNGAMFIEGIASTTAIDETDERMSPEAISKMAARLVGKPLRSEHGKGWDDRLGEIVQADVVADKNNRPALWIKAKLFDWSSKAKDLFKMLMSGVDKMGLSVAGRVHPNGINKELDEAVGKYIPTYHDVDPTEVSVTDHPANLDTFAIAVSKSLESTGISQFETNPIPSTTTVQGAKKDQATDVFQCAHEKCQHGGCIEKGCDALKCIKCFGKVKKAGLAEALDFNKNGRGDSSPEKWAQLGKQIAQSLGEGYAYDPATEKIITPDTQKFIGEEVNIMQTNKGNLVSDAVDPQVAAFVKFWNPKTKVQEVQKTDGDDEQEAENPSTGAQAPAENAEDAAANPQAPAKADAEAGAGADGVEKAGSSSSYGSASDSNRNPSKPSGNASTTTAAKDDSSSSDSSSSDGSSSGSSDSSDSSGSMDSLLSSIMSTLSDIKSSMSSSSSSSDSSSTPSSTGSSSTDTSSGSTTSTDKGGSSSSDSGSSTSSGSSSSDSSSQSSDSASLLSLSRALDELKTFADSLKKGQPTNPKTQAAASGTQTATPANTSDSVSKALDGIAKLTDQVGELKKLFEADREARLSTPNQRKGVAVPNANANGKAVEKNIAGGSTPTFKQETYNALLTDDRIGPNGKPMVTFQDVYKYKSSGELPKNWTPAPASDSK